jgi:predicted LPLAT superfamily acyltransferase
MKKNTGFIVACSHIGNFELSGFLYRHQQKKTYALVYDGENSNLQQVRIKAMRQANIEAVSVCEDMSHLFTLKNALENGDIISIPCDRIYGSSKKIKCEFLGREAYFPLAPFRLATQMNVPVIAFFMMKEKSTKYHAYIFPVEPHSDEPDRIKKAEQMAACFVRNCEDILRKYPQQWFNFYDFWKL